MSKVNITVQELVNKTLRRELLLPEMQRRYVWPGTRVRDLLDSLYRGYPSGTILVWETDSDVQTREISVETTESPSTSTKQLLLDGQQRITSLTAVLSGHQIQVRGRKRPIDILFNLDHPEGPPLEVTEVEEEVIDELEEEGNTRNLLEELQKRAFSVSSPVLKGNPSWISVSEIFTKTEKELLRPLGINSDDDRWDKYSARIAKVRNISNYSFVMEVLQKDMSYEEVTEIFVRVNSLGIKLRSSDLAIAQITSKWKGFMDELEEFAKEFGDDNEYIINWVAIRMLTVFATKQPLFKSVGRIKKEKLQEAWETAKDGIRFAVNFLRSNAGISDLQLMSASSLVIPLAVYAELQNEVVSEEEVRKMLKWFYIAHMRGHYSKGSSESILAADLNVLFRGGSMDNLLIQLKNHVIKFDVDTSDIEGKTTNNPFFSLLYIILKKEGAKDWFTSLTISDKHTGSTHKIQFHHIFPKSLLQDMQYDKREINEIANMAFIGGGTNRSITNKLPKEYLQKAVDEGKGELLKKQMVPLDPSLWDLNHYPEFLTYRREQIAQKVNTFLTEL
jgi:hypothetical protein